jgi:hypothetical protein
MRRKKILIAVLFLTAALVLVVGAAFATGLCTIEGHRGFFAPVWDPAGENVYFIQRDTSGISWGPGWEHFTPPASAYVMQDAITLRRLNPKTGDLETLGTWKTPVLGRTIKEYRGRIFNTMSARADSDQDGVDYLVRMAIPRIPTSEVHVLRGRWTPGGSAGGTWTQDPGGGVSYGNHVLVGGTELLTVRGSESFPAAIVSTTNNRDHEVLIRNDEFDDLYPDGVPPQMLEERSRRELIEKVERDRRVRSELVNEFLAQGMNLSDAELQAIYRMEDMGLYRKGPRMIAQEIAAPAPQDKTFTISETEFLVGLFQNIEAAIEKPGSKIRDASTRYIIHRDYDTSRQLNAWLDAGNTEFVVRAKGKLYRISILK